MCNDFEALLETTIETLQLDRQFVQAPSNKPDQSGLLWQRHRLETMAEEVCSAWLSAIVYALTRV